jgi:hypothetical protein
MTTFDIGTIVWDVPSNGNISERYGSWEVINKNTSKQMVGVKLIEIHNPSRFKLGDKYWLKYDEVCLTNDGTIDQLMKGMGY